MTDSASITVTNHRLRKAMSNANDDDLKSHTKKLGDKIKSELKLRLGEILKIYPYRDKCEVKIKGTSETETCLIAHDILSEGMNVSGFPKGRVTHEKAEEVIIPSETIYGIILDVDIGNKQQKCIISYINLDRKHTPNNASKGEYKIQVGKNVISLTDKYININSDNLFINGLPYTEAYKPLVDYPDKEEVGEITEELQTSIIEQGKRYILSIDNANPKIDTKVNVSCKVLDMENNPISNEKITLKHNNNIYASSYTNAQGINSWNINMTEWGMHTFSVNDNIIQAYVTGWRVLKEGQPYDIRYNEDTVKCVISIDRNVTMPTGWTLYDRTLLGNMAETLKPQMPVTVINWTGTSGIGVRETDPGLYVRSLTGSQISTSVYGQLEWHYR